MAYSSYHINLYLSNYRMALSLVIITWLAYSCRNRMLRHCPTDDRIIVAKRKVSDLCFCENLSSFDPSFAQVKACAIMAIVNFVTNNQIMHWHRLYCKETPKNCRAYHFNYRINAPTELSKIVIKIRNAYVWHIYLISGYRFMIAFAVQSLV